MNDIQSPFLVLVVEIKYNRYFEHNNACASYSYTSQCRCQERLNYIHGSFSFFEEKAQGYGLNI